MSFIGIDLGASFIKAAWLNTDKNLVEDVIREPFPPFLSSLASGRKEVETGEILQVVQKLLKKFLEDRGGCDGLLLCGQMHGFVLMSPDRKKFNNFISWQDTRCLSPSDASDSFFSQTEKRLGSPLISALGNELRPGLPLTTLFTLKLAGQLPAGWMPVALPDFVAAQVTGSPAVTHASNAAAHGLLNVASGEWSEEARQRLGLEEVPLPTIKQFNEPTGTIKFKESSFPVYTPVGDQQAALLGSGLLSREVSLNIATGSQVSCISSSSVHGNWQLRPYFGGKWLRTVTHLPAGRALNKITSLLGELATDQGTPLRKPWENISKLAARANPKKLHVELSFFPSSVGREGAFEHITEEELNVGSIFRAAFRSMAGNYLSAARTVAPEGWSKLVFSGGLAMKSRILREEITDRFGCPHRLSDQPEDALAGLLVMAKSIQGRSGIL